MTHAISTCLFLSGGTRNQATYSVVAADFAASSWFCPQGNWVFSRTEETACRRGSWCLPSEIQQIYCTKKDMEVPWIRKQMLHLFLHTLGNCSKGFWKITANTTKQINCYYCLSHFYKVRVERWQKQWNTQERKKESKQASKQAEEKFWATKKRRRHKGAGHNARSVHLCELIWSRQLGKPEKRWFCEDKRASSKCSAVSSPNNAHQDLVLQTALLFWLIPTAKFSCTHNKWLLVESCENNIPAAACWTLISTTFTEHKSLWSCCQGHTSSPTKAWQKFSSVFCCLYQFSFSFPLFFNTHRGILFSFLTWCGRYKFGLCTVAAEWDVLKGHGNDKINNNG